VSRDEVGLGTNFTTGFKLPVKLNKFMTQYRMFKGKTQKKVFSKYRTVKGVRIYHPKGKHYVFWVDVE
jgi:hypothetical protein